MTNNRQVQMMQQFYSFQFMYNNQKQLAHQTQAINFEGDSKISEQRIAVFMVQKMLQRRKRQSSQPYQSISYNRMKGHIKERSNRKIFTISYTDEKKISTNSQFYNQQNVYQQLINKTKQAQKQYNNASKNSRKHTQDYRIKSFTSMKQTDDKKRTPLIMKYMKQAFKNYNLSPNPLENLQQKSGVYGLSIQQIKTFKILRKKEKLNDRYCSFDEPENKLTKTLLGYQNESNDLEKISNPTKGGGFNIMSVKKRIKKNQQIDDINGQFLKAIIYKKESFPQNYNKSKQQKQNISIHGLKFAKMINCLDIILNSFHLSLKIQEKPRTSLVYLSKKKQQVPNEQNVQKFTYFIGFGNNAELVRSIIKKRSWWVETSNPLKAHFIWSQLKIKKVINKQTALIKERDVKSIIFYYENDINNDKPSNLLKISPQLPINHEQNLKFSKINFKQNAYKFLFHERHCKKYYFPLPQSERKQRLQSISSPQLYSNHFQFNHKLGNKNSMYFNLNLYFQFKKQNISQIVPLTYYLTAKVDNLQQIQGKIKEEQNQLWILKPGQNSNRGQRITLARNIDDIKVKLAIQRKLIVQSYIKNVLLYNGRKFDIRTYLLGINFNGRLKFYFYEQGYIKTSSFQYNLKNINDKYVHLTNDAIQQTSDKYGKYQEGNKLSYGEFQRYLESKHQKEEFDIFQLHQTMRKHASEVVKATYHKLNSNKKSFCFELFGLDFLVDSNFKPYLIEVNTNPCLELCSHSLERLIPRMMQNLFRISLDPLFRPQVINNTKAQSYYLYDQQFLEKNQFRLIFDQRYDRDAQWQKYSMESLEQKNRIFQTQDIEEEEIPQMDK